LILHGADVNTQNDVGQTPLHSAALHNELPCAEILVQHGANVDVKDLRGKTALMLAQGVAHGDKMVAFLSKQQEQDGTVMPGSYNLVLS